MKKVKWLENAVFYNIYPQSFYDSNDDGIGDLNGITEKLDYVKDMGFNAIWLNPFYESSFRDAGYDVTDYYKVAERYGTIQDFENLCKKAHELGIKVCIDLVAGHTSLECEWFKQSAQVEVNEYTNRYIWTPSWDNVYNGQCIAGYSDRNGCYMKNYYYCQPALNYGFAQIDEPDWQLPPDHPDCLATKAALVDIMEYWLGKGCDGFRVDMANSLIKNDPTGEGIVKFWNEIRKMFDEKYPECILISEWSKPSQAIKAGFHIDFMLHFNTNAYNSLLRAEEGRNVNKAYIGNSFFHASGKGDIAAFLEDYLKEYNSTKDRGYISIPTGNHDLPRVSIGRNNKELELVNAFVLTLPGVPFVYYGDEIGMKYAANIPSKEGGYNRTGSRTPMQWDNTKNHGFSKADAERIYLPTDHTENAPTVADQYHDENSLLNITKKLIAVRKSSKALCAEGSIEFLNKENRGYPLIYSRSYGDEKYMICINPTNQIQTFAAELNFETVMQNSEFHYEDNVFTLQPVSFAILKVKQ